MFEKLKIQKKEKTIEISVRLKKKVNPKDPIVKFSWKEAQRLVKEKHPEVDIGGPIEIKLVLRNDKGNVLEDTWAFPIIEKFVEKTIEKVPEKNNKVIQIPKKKNRLTKIAKNGTVEKTAQTELSGIVQEPTE